jgi:uncharacterized protein YjbI with pentapeptide repeats
MFLFGRSKLGINRYGKIKGSKIPKAFTLRNGNEGPVLEHNTRGRWPEQKDKILNEREIDGEKFLGVDFSTWTSDITNKVFRNCKFSVCKMDKISIQRCEFINCEFEQVDMHSAVTYSKMTIIGTTFEACMFTKVNFSNKWFQTTKFRDCEMKNCIARNARFQNVLIEKYTRADIYSIEGGDFTHSSFKQSTFTTIFPDGLLKIKNVDFSNSWFLDTKLQNCRFETVNFRNSWFAAFEMIRAQFIDSTFVSSRFENSNAHTNHYRYKIVSSRFENTDFTRASFQYILEPENFTNNEFINVVGYLAPRALPPPPVLGNINNNNNPNRPSAARALEVHQKSSKIMRKIGELITILKTHLEVRDADMHQYDDILRYMNNTLGERIRTSPEFEEHRGEYVRDWTLILEKLRGSEITVPMKHMMGLITDFLFRHNLQDEFLKAYVPDCTQAYGPGGMSCVGGIRERFPVILRDFILDKSGGVFDELKGFYNVKSAKSWKNYNAGMQKAYVDFWNKHFQEWLQSKGENAATLAMNSNTRKQALLDYIKAKYREEHNGNELPKEVEDHYKQTYLNDLDWGLFGFEGGSRRRMTRRKAKKLKKTRKH